MVSSPVNVSFFPKSKFSKALQAMKPVFEGNICVGDLVAVTHEGERIGELIVPDGKAGFATVCSIVINGALLKAVVPIDSKFGGILETRDHRPLRFVELIHYAGSSLDSSEGFIRASMTAVKEAVKGGNGKILADFCEIPTLCRGIATEYQDLTRFGEL